MLVGHGPGDVHIRPRVRLRPARILRFADESLGPIAGVLLVVGAGGGFGACSWPPAPTPPSPTSSARRTFRRSILGYFIAALLRLSVGSATVAFITTATVMAPAQRRVAYANNDLLVMAIGAGSVIASHVNDGGFWLVKDTST